MKVAEHWSKEQKKQLNKVKSPQKKFSKRELEELMGMHMDIYERKNGAIRRK